MLDINDVPESKDVSFTLLPAGGYRVVVAEVRQKWKENNIHSGSSWISAKFDILPYHGAGDYEFAGRSLFCNYTLENANREAVEIGKAILCDLMFACNVTRVSHESELATVLPGKEIYVYVAIAKRKDNQQNENRIMGYWSLGGRQRRLNPKPIPPPPSAADIAAAPPLPSKNAPGNSAQSYPPSHPAFDNDVPF